MGSLMTSATFLARLLARRHKDAATRGTRSTSDEKVGYPGNKGTFGMCSTATADTFKERMC